MGDTISNLQQLVAPLPDAEFLALLRERKLTLLRGSRPDRYAALLDWETLQGAIARGGYLDADFRVTNESKQVSLPFYTSNGKVDLAKLRGLLDKGVSIIFSALQPHVPALSALCRDIGAQVAENVTVSAVVTTGAGGALTVHYDAEDILIVQLEGSKRWQIVGPPVINPVRGMPEQLAPSGLPFFDEVLTPGDSLLVPAGNWHHCQNGPGRSIHVAIQFYAPTGWQLVKPLLQEFSSEADFRVRLTRLESEEELSALEARLKDRLTDFVSRLSLRDLLAQDK